MGNVEGSRMQPPPAGADKDSRVSADIARQVSQALRELTGRGPDRIRVYLNDEAVTCLMTGEPSRIERSLLAGDKARAVLAQRRTVLAATSRALSAIVGTATGLHVTTFLSDTAISPDVTVLTFVLDHSRQAAKPAHVPPDAGS